MLTSAYYCVLLLQVAKNRRTITVLLPDAEYIRFHKYCQSKGFKKSTLLARLIREHLNAENYADQAELVFQNPKRAGKH